MRLTNAYSYNNIVIIIIINYNYYNKGHRQRVGH
jgi:hypothetical protein